MVSIVVPVYNKQLYLKECLDSICGQSYRDLEIILVNDGSTDKSLDICKQYADTDRRIKIIDQKNQGVSAARNRGISVSSGEYLSFIDADDVLATDFFLVLHELAERGNADIVQCGFCRFQEKSQLQHLFSGNETESEDIWDSRKACLELCGDKGIENGIVCNKIFRKPVFEGQFFSEGRGYEDVDITYRLFYRAKRIVCTSQILYGYRFSPNSTMTTRVDGKCIQMLDVFKERTDFFKGKNDKELVYLSQIKQAKAMMELYVKTCYVGNQNRDVRKEILDRAGKLEAEFAERNEFMDGREQKLFAFFRRHSCLYCIMRKSHILLIKAKRHLGIQG